jgi:hypothetical protein
VAVWDAEIAADATQTIAAIVANHLLVFFMVELRPKDG